VRFLYIISIEIFWQALEGYFEGINRAFNRFSGDFQARTAQIARIEK